MQGILAIAGFALFLRFLLGDDRSNEIDASKVFTGHPTGDLLGRIKRSIRMRLRNDGYDEIYVGRTGRLDERKKEHIEKLGDFSRFYIVYKTSSKRNAQKVEAELIDYFENLDEFDLLNKAKGSPGPSGEPPYYVYVAAR